MKKDAKHEELKGAPGTGKTTRIKRKMLALADRADCAIAAFFPVAEPGEDFLLHLENHGHMNRVVVHDQRDMNNVLFKQLIRISSEPDPFVRREENERYCTAFLDLPARRRHMEALAIFPAIEKYSKLAVESWQVTDMSSQWIPPFAIGNILIPEHPLHHYVFRHMPEGEDRWELMQVAFMNKHDWVTLVLPAVRFLKGALDNAHMRATCSRRPTFNLPAHLRRCKTGEPGIYVSLGNASKEATSLNIVCDVQQIVFDALTKPWGFDCHIARDELLNWDLYGAPEAQFHAIMRNYRVNFTDALQSYAFPTEEIAQSFRQNTSIKRIFRCNDPDMAFEAARSLMRMLDENKIHHFDESVHTVPEIIYERRESEGVSIGPDGKRTTNRNSSLVPVTRHHERVDRKASYQQGNEQLFWLAQKIQNLPDLKCIVQERHGQPYEDAVRLLPNLCPVRGDFELEVKRCLNQLKNSPLYQKPEVWTTPAIPSIPKQAPAKKPNSNPKGTRGKKTVKSKLSAS
jgi:hypothetical protein